MFSLYSFIYYNGAVVHPRSMGVKVIPLAEDALGVVAIEDKVLGLPVPSGVICGEPLEEAYIVFL